MAGINEGDGRFYVVGTSLGAMMTLHIMAKRWGKVYPYQSMVKGFISISALLIPRTIGFLTRAGFIGKITESLLSRKIIPGLLKLFTSIWYYTKTKDQIDKEITKIRKSKKGLTAEQFDEAAKTKIKSILKARIKNTTKKILTKGDYRIYFEELNEKQLEDLAELILENIHQGRKAIDTGRALDIRALIKRDATEIIDYKSSGALLKFGYGIRKDVEYIQIPILVIHGSLDTLADPRSADLIYNRVKTQYNLKSKLMLKRTGHIPMIDFDKKKVFKESANFIINTEKIYGEKEKERRRKVKQEHALVPS